MLEIEQKYKNADFPDLENRLASLGALPAPAQDESDHYFNAPDRDFAHTDEAFRLRRVGATSLLTYKGPKQRSSVKVRTELEVPLADGPSPAEDCLTLLTHLGYKPVAVVHKRRRPYHLNRDGFAVTVCLDAVADLGDFAEVEILAEEDRLPAAQTVLATLAAELGLSAIEKGSYLGLVLARLGESKK